MKLGIDGKIALVTGAGRGIGRAIADGLASEGVRVVSVSRHAADLATGKNHVPIEMDLIPEGACQRLLDDLRTRNLVPDIVVNNLGGTIGSIPQYCSVADWRKSYRFNFEIAVELDALLIPTLIERKWGRILHVSSISALEAQGHPTYCAMKAALMAYSRSIGRSLSPHNVVVSSLLPGAVLTENGYWEKATEEKPEHVKAFLAERMAIGRFGRPEEISQLALFLCSELASFVAGSSFLVDGGQGRSFLCNFD